MIAGPRWLPAPNPTPPPSPLIVAQHKTRPSFTSARPVQQK